MKMTIEERATDLFSDFIDCIESNEGGGNGYYIDEKRGNALSILAFKEQQKIDFEKAWEVFQKYATFEHPRKGTTECVMTKSQFRKAMGMEE